jgi:hypothetical protein
MNENLDLKFPPFGSNFLVVGGKLNTQLCTIDYKCAKNKNKQKSLLAIDDGCWGVQLDKSQDFYNVHINLKNFNGNST